MADFVWMGKYLVNCEGLVCAELYTPEAVELYYKDGAEFTLDFESQEERDRALHMVRTK